MGIVRDIEDGGEGGGEGGEESGGEGEREGILLTKACNGVPLQRSILL